MNELLPSWALVRRRDFGAACSALLLAACGGGGGGEATTPVALRFEAIDPFIAPGGRLFLRVQAEYRDGSTVDVTSLASWNATQPSVASVGNTSATTTAGLVTGVTAGQTDIVASYQGVTATLSVTRRISAMRR